MIRRTGRGDIVTSQHTRSTKRWFHFPVGTPIERITVATAPVVSVDERARLRLVRRESGPREG
jgi:hypothetical protein